MTVSAAVPKTAPVMIAWEAFKATEEYATAARWALKEQHTEGSLWHAFYTGFYACAVNNATHAQDVAGLVKRLEAMLRVLTDVDIQMYQNSIPLSNEVPQVRKDIQTIRDALALLRPSPISHESKGLELAAADNNPQPVISLDTPYVPVAIHYPERDVLEFVERDVPVIEQAFAHAALSVLLDMDTRAPIGWRIPGWSRIAPADNNHKALVEALEHIAEYPGPNADDAAHMRAEIARDALAAFKLKGAK